MAQIESNNSIVKETPDYNLEFQKAYHDFNQFIDKISKVFNVIKKGILRIICFKSKKVKKADMKINKQKFTEEWEKHYVELINLAAKKYTNPVKILVIDDDEYILDFIQCYNQYHEKLKMDYVNTCKDAFETVKTKKFDVVLSDIQLPDGNGINLLEKISNKYPKIIRVSMSGSLESEVYKNVSNQSLIEYFVQKPLHFDILDKLFYGFVSKKVCVN